MVSHIPDKGQVLQRYYGWYASRTRGIRRRAGTEEQQTVYAEPVPVPRREAHRRWTELLRLIFEVEPLECPQCGQTMRIVAFITEPQVIDRILDSLRRTAAARRVRAHRLELPGGLALRRVPPRPLDRCTPNPDCWFGDVWGARQTPMTEPQPGRQPSGRADRDPAQFSSWQRCIKSLIRVARHHQDHGAYFEQGNTGQSKFLLFSITGKFRYPPPFDAM